MSTISIATSGIKNIVLVYRSVNALWYRVGHRGHSNIITWGETRVLIRYNENKHHSPSVSMNRKGDVVVIYDTSVSFNICVGKLGKHLDINWIKNGNGTIKNIVYNTKVKESPSISIADDNTVIVTYQTAFKVYYRFGKLDNHGNVSVWGNRGHFCGFGDFPTMKLYTSGTSSYVLLTVQNAFGKGLRYCRGKLEPGNIIEPNIDWDSVILSCASYRLNNNNIHANKGVVNRYGSCVIANIDENYGNSVCFRKGDMGKGGGQGKFSWKEIYSRLGVDGIVNYDIALFDSGELVFVYTNNRGEIHDCSIDLSRNEKEGNLWQKRQIVVDLENIVRRTPAGTPYDFNVVNAGGDTMLHRMAKSKRWKNYARLRYLGANQTIVDRAHRRPGTYLVNKIAKIRELQRIVTTRTQDLQRTAAQVLAAHTSARQGDGELDHVQAEQTYTQLWQNQHVRPLLKLAKLAALGMHILSKRARFIDDGYDSDDDETERITENQSFEVIIDPHEDTLARIAAYGVEGREGRGFLGVYYPGSNTIYVAGQRVQGDPQRNVRLVRATFVHELTHFVAHEVFQNGCKPYASTDDAHKRQFEQIATAINGRRGRLNSPILERTFTYDPYRINNQIHDELIVRVIQEVLADQQGAAHAINGLNDPQRGAPALWAYYTNVFLPAVEAHVVDLKRRAHGGWPVELFRPRGQPIDM